MEARSFTLDTQHGLISITDTALKNDSPALLLLHSNSLSSKIFKHIFASPTLTKTHQIITFDFPGHGASSNAPDPTKTYSMRGYAELAIEILKHLNVRKVAVLGWSLGGHVGIEMIPLLHSRSNIIMEGLMLIGAPPANGLEETDQAFTFTDGHMSVAAKKDLTDEEIKTFARSCAGEPFETWMEDDVRRTDGRARYYMWKSFAEGKGVDQRDVVGSEEYRNTIIGFVNGANEPFVNLEYIRKLPVANLWDGVYVEVEGRGHAPFWEWPDSFEELLVRFLGTIEAAEAERIANA